MGDPTGGSERLWVSSSSASCRGGSRSGSWALGELLAGSTGFLPRPVLGCLAAPALQLGCQCLLGQGTVRRGDFAGRLSALPLVCVVTPS